MRLPSKSTRRMYGVDRVKSRRGGAIENIRQIVSAVVVTYYLKLVGHEIGVAKNL